MKKNENLNTRVFRGLFISIVLAVSIFSIVVKPALALDPLVVWTEYGVYDDFIRFSAYSSGWGSEGTASDTNDSVRLTWHVAKTSPDGAEQVALAVGSTSITVYATLYDGTDWNTKKNLSPTYTSAYRGFSAAYEQSSGDLLIVQGIVGNNQIKYWVWDGDTWVVDGTTYTFDTGTINNDVVWGELSAYFLQEHCLNNLFIAEKAQGSRENCTPVFSFFYLWERLPAANGYLSATIGKIHIL